MKISFRYLLGLTLLLIAFGQVNAQEQVLIEETPQINIDLMATAVLPLPEEYREGASILGYKEDGSVEILREGTNDLHCLADKPGDDRFQAVCYHKSMEAFIARGRELRAEGVEDVNAARHKEIDDGTLQAPEAGSTLYNMISNLDEFDPETAAPTLYAIYIPYASLESTGLSTSARAPGAPWMMRQGTASAHIMVVMP